jgi:CIC family chloride channel protein
LPRRLRPADHRTLLVAGAAAGVAAIFKAPATGVVFALEVPYRDDLARRSLLPALVAAATGYLVFVAIHGTAPLFPATGNPSFSLRDLGGAVLLGILGGLGARLMASGIRGAKSFSTTPIALRFAVVVPVFLALFVACRALTGENLVVGPGYQAIDWAGHGGHSVWLLLAVFALRGLATSACVGAGGTGGIFVPLAVGGALVGRATAELVGSLDRGLFTVLGTAAFLGAGYRVPLAGVMFVAETSGRPGFVVPGLIAAVVAELMMGHGSVTAYQRER